MAEKLKPATAEETDISKAQSAQQPTTEAEQQPETGEQLLDIEGVSQQPEERGEEESGFIGTEGKRDTSSDLIEEVDEDEEFRRDGE